MKKAVSILALVVMGMGLFSCEPETNVAETQAMYTNLDQPINDTLATDGEIVPTDDRD